MANIKQQKKRIGTAQRQRLENLRYRSQVKTLFNKLQLAVDTGERTVAETTHKELVSLLDRATTRGSFHRNTTSRRKARASRILLQEAKTDTAAVRKAKKKTAPVARKPKVDKAETAKKPAAKKAPAKKAAPAAEAEVEAPVVTEEATPEAAAPEAAVEETAADETPAEEAPAEEKTDEA